MFASFVRLALYGIGLVLVLMLIGSGFHVVPHGSVGVVLVNVGDRPILDRVLEPGWYWRRPFVVRVEMFPTTIHGISVDLKVFDRERLPFQLETILNVSLVQNEVVGLCQSFGHFYALETALRNRLTETLTAEACRWSRDQAFDKRDMLEKSIAEVLGAKVPKGVRIDSFVVKDVKYPEEYHRSLDALPFRAALTSYEIQGYSVERRKIDLSLSVVYRVDPSMTVQVVNTLGAAFRETLLKPLVVGKALAVLAGSKADDVFSTEGREEFGRTVLQKITSDLKQHGILVERVVVEGVTFEPTLMAAIQERERGKVLLSQMDTKLAQTQKEAAILRFKAEESSKERLLSAETEAKTRQIEAQSLKEAAILKADGDRESLSRIATIIEKNPKLLDYLSISRLSDKVQVIVAPPGTPGLGSIVPSVVPPVVPKESSLR